MCRIWKMGRNLFSSLDIRDNSKVAYLEKKSNNPNICLVTGSGFFELSILCNCTTVWGTGCVRNLSWDLWASLSVNLALANCVELRCACEIFVAYCTCSLGLPLSSIDIFLSTVVTKWSNSYKKTLLTQSVILITRYKSGTILFWGRCQLIFDKIFPKNATFKLSLMSNDEPKNFIHFYILHIKNVWFLLKLEMALVTTIKMKFALVWYRYLHN